MSMNVEEKRGLYDEFKKSGIKVATFARKRGIAKTTMRRLVKDYETGKFDTVHARGEAKRVRISHYDGVGGKQSSYHRTCQVILTQE